MAKLKSNRAELEKMSTVQLQKLASRRYKSLEKSLGMKTPSMYGYDRERNNAKAYLKSLRANMSHEYDKETIDRNVKFRTDVLSRERMIRFLSAETSSVRTFTDIRDSFDYIKDDGSLISEFYQAAVQNGNEAMFWEFSGLAIEEFGGVDTDYYKYGTGGNAIQEYGTEAFNGDTLEERRDEMYKYMQNYVSGYRGRQAKGRK